MNHEQAAQSTGSDEKVEEKTVYLRVGSSIKEMRQKAGITQEELARRLHTTKSAVSRLENRTSGARVATLAKVAQAFGKELIIKFY